MQNRNFAFVSILLGILTLSLFVAGCAEKQKGIAKPDSFPPLTTVHQIDSFNPAEACRQALEVINNNPYAQQFFEKVFARVVDQCQNNKSRTNADIIWEQLVIPLKRSGKVPPDLATMLWNCYFSRQFVCLPGMGPVAHYCHRLPEIKKKLEKEYLLKKLGFEICQQGSVDPHFLNAMYVYNTMWAACHGTE